MEVNQERWTIRAWKHQNVPGEEHAKEHIFTLNKSNRLKIVSMFVRLQPCSNRRYGNNYGCMSFFNGGRNVGNLGNCRFVPVTCDETRHKGRYTVIFYMESQIPAGQKSQTGNLGRAGKSGNTPPGQQQVTRNGVSNRGSGAISGMVAH